MAQIDISELVLHFYCRLVNIAQFSIIGSKDTKMLQYDWFRVETKTLTR
jgi:hypothetical protein